MMVTATLLTFDGGFFGIAPSSQLTLKNITLNGIGPNSIFCFDDTGTITLDNVIWAQSGNYSFDHGTLINKTSVALTGPYIFAYQSLIPDTIADNSTLSLDGDIVFKIGRATVGGPDPLYFTTKQSVLACGQCTIHITASGIGLTRGSVQILKDVVTEIESTNTACGLILGDNSSPANDITFYLGPGCVNRIKSGAVVYNNTNGNGFSSASSSSRVILDIGMILHMATTFTFASDILELEYNGISLPQITLAPGTRIYMNNTNIVIPGVSNTTYLAQSLDGSTFILDSNDSIYLSSGLLGANTSVINSGNTITGIGSIVAPITFANSASSLILTLQGIVEAPIILSGGTLIINSNVTFHVS